MNITKNDFLYILADGIQQHEGWTIGSRSVINNNPGNIKDVGQALVIGHDQNNFAETANPLNGKLLQIHDLTLKIDSGKYNSIREIISVYAPPSDNNTEAYIASIVMFFNKRNIPVTDTMTLAEIFALPVEMIQIVIDNLWAPADWQSIQSSIELAASWMKEFGFSTRYVNAPVSASNFVSTASPIGTLLSLDGNFTQSIVAPQNEGQKINILIYSLALNGQAGGAEYAGCAVSPANLMSSYSSVLFNGSAFTEPDARVLFHEIIHSLFTLTGLLDTLHAYLVAHGGYANNTLVDLQEVYQQIIVAYKSGTKIVQQAQVAVATAKAEIAIPADRASISQLLAAAVASIKNWFN